MIHIAKILLFIFTMTSCSQVNRNSREYFSGKETIRHGVLPKVSVNNLSTTDNPIDQAAAMKGEKTYKKHCLNCHGMKGRGNGLDASKQDTVPANLVEVVRKVPQFKFYMMISRWKGKMPGWNNMFSEKDIKYLEHYIRSLASKAK